MWSTQVLIGSSHETERGLVHVCSSVSLINFVLVLIYLAFISTFVTLLIYIVVYIRIVNLLSFRNLTST